MQSNSKKILLGITGGIAAYKAAELVRRLKERGYSVRVVMTAGAKAFITPLTLQALSGLPVHEDLLDTHAEAAMGHIELAKWADFIVVAPASANFIARLAHGFADDLLTTLCLASAAPIAIAPAMNQQMWQAAATQDNIALLKHRKVAIWGPAAGEQACGDVGPGRMLEPMALVEHIMQCLHLTHALTGKRLVITAGPTQEAIDPVRYLTNHSSGKMGYALAQAAQQYGAEVILISGPVALTAPAGVKRIDVTTAQQMQTAVMQAISHCDIFIATAAVADYRCEKPANQKLKKTADTLTVELVKNPDILTAVASLPQRPFCIGFAAETENLLQHANEKLQHKQLDMIAANLVGVADQGFAADQNALTVLWPGGHSKIALAEKYIVAKQLLDIIATRYNVTPSLN